MMRDFFRKRMATALLGAAFVFPCAGSALAGNPSDANNPPAGGNQRDIYINNYHQDAAGSDDSLKSSTVYAMQALMDLSKLNLVSAMKEGYGAYGKYRNAENLDHLKDESALRANLMGSVGSDAVLPTTRTDTTFGRLDPSFLSQGDAGKVAAEFERETGMKRAEFLSQIASVSEQKIKRSDPAMIDKALSRFEGFLQKIPNAEFRKNAEKGIAMVPDTMRRGMVASAVTKLAGFFADSGKGGSALPSSISDLTRDKLAGIPGASGAAGAGGSAVTGAGDLDPSKAGGAEGNRDPAAVEATNSGAVTPAPNAAGKTGFDGVVAAALRESRSNASADETLAAGEVTIFQQITKRYRLLTPQITKAPN